MQRPLVSIIMPVYNRASLIEATLETLKQQTYTNWECIIVDDGSVDDTKKIALHIANTDDRFKVFERPKEVAKGANGCRNYGFKLAKGAFVNWFDSDDIMKPTFVEEKVDAFKEDTDAVMHRNNYGNYQLYDFRDSKFEYEKDNLFYHYAMETIEIQTCSFMWKRAYLKDKFLFDEAIQRYQDNEFHIRMLALKPQIEIVENVLATIRSGSSHKGQISNRDNVTKKKLYDIFYCRYQSLKCANVFGLDKNKTFVTTISKKMLWAFYGALSFETNMFKRVKDVFKYSDKLKLVYVNKKNSLGLKVKSILYIIKVIIFR